MSDPDSGLMPVGLSTPWDPSMLVMLLIFVLGALVIVAVAVMNRHSGPTGQVTPTDPTADPALIALQQPPAPNALPEPTPDQALRD
ncbi:hypothetical protein NLU66_03420 [Brachybacterium sp. NBEC-018]|uniref:hypothetical protein n=1 Tax=Brachybacterium sp. NBEC-018 TaxID=2996004 RepID=UPI002174FE29|nr:hypothetical protein [Brachybacterium sp. NBEC-018]UVY84661.1 hypothetical protein NLU66_03420 [Brachybacterium sp. NBEC-018]